MKSIRGSLLGVAAFQALSTLWGFILLLVKPQWFAPMLTDSVFEGKFVAAALLLGIVVGGFQWAAILVHLRAPQWLTLGHSVAGLVMIGWIAGECLVLNMFAWPHALWGGVGVVQLLLVLVLLGVMHPQAGLVKVSRTHAPAMAGQAI